MGTQIETTSPPIRAISHTNNAEAGMAIVAALGFFFMPSGVDTFVLLLFLFCLILVGTVFHYTYTCDMYRRRIHELQVENQTLKSRIASGSAGMVGIRDRVLADVRAGR